mmetsp:Transcript_84208/g.163598  ORF Transcript_84208/g.163598 Transcript_84208/m.163598 type:complete len:201 (+) Transcript_84208:134-736(+)
MTTTPGLAAASSSTACARPRRPFSTLLRASSHCGKTRRVEVRTTGAASTKQLAGWMDGGQLPALRAIRPSNHHHHFHRFHFYPFLKALLVVEVSVLLVVLLVGVHPERAHPHQVGWKDRWHLRPLVLHRHRRELRTPTEPGRNCPPHHLPGIFRPRFWPPLWPPLWPRFWQVLPLSRWLLQAVARRAVRPKMELAPHPRS